MVIIWIFEKDKVQGFTISFSWAYVVKRKRSGLWNCSLLSEIWLRGWVCWLVHASLFTPSQRRKDLCVSLEICQILIKSPSLSGKNISKGGKNDVFYSILGKNIFLILFLICKSRCPCSSFLRCPCLVDVFSPSYLHKPSFQKGLRCVFPCI